MARLLILIAACLAAALAAGISGSLALTALSLATGGMAPEADLVSGLIVFTILLCLYGLTAAIVIGLPAHALLMGLRRTGVLSYVAAGAVAGLAVSAIFMLPAGVVTELAPKLQLLGAGLFCGAVGAWSFWSVARPDRRAAALASRP